MSAQGTPNVFVIALAYLDEQIYNFGAVDEKTPSMFPEKKQGKEDAA